MKRQTIVGLIAASIAASVVMVAAAADVKYCANGIWPKVACDADGKLTPEFTEWFTDIPWRQKLGTYQGNKIDVAIVLPYDVLRPNAKTACSTAKPVPLTEEQCMIEIGVTNIVGTFRSDTKYDPNDPRIKDAKIGETQLLLPGRQPSLHRGQAGGVQLVGAALGQHARPGRQHAEQAALRPRDSCPITSTGSCSPTRRSTPRRCPGTCRTTAIHSGTATRRIPSATPTICRR